MSKFIVIENRKVWLRGAYALKYHTLPQPEHAKAKEASRWESSNPRLAERIRAVSMLKWLRAGGAILKTEGL